MSAISEAAEACAEKTGVPVHKVLSIWASYIAMKSKEEYAKAPSTKS